MAQRKPTPEEQLLKLIENSQSSTGSTESKTADKSAKPAGIKKSFLSGLFAGRKKEAKPAEPVETATKTAPSFFQIKAVNNILVALVLAAGIYLILDLFVFKTDQAQFLSQVGTTDPVYPILGADYGDGAEDVDYYQQPLQRRNPFLSSSIEIISDSGGGADEFRAVSREPSANMSDILSGFTLVGISWSSEYPLAMIEDTSTGRTHFLREGQELQGMKVQKITKEKVMITYEGEEGTLF